LDLESRQLLRHTSKHVTMSMIFAWFLTHIPNDFWSIVWMLVTCNDECTFILLHFTNLREWAVAVTITL
jgi:hypothetical protein